MPTSKQEMLDYAEKHKSVDQLYWQKGFKSFADSIINLQEFTSRHLPPDREEEFWRKYLQEVKDHVERLRTLDDKTGGSSDGSPKFYCFYTINYDDSKSITIDIMHKNAQIILGYDFVDRAMYVHEKHGADGNIHHHTHILIVSSKKTFPSKYTDKPSGNREIKKWIGGKQFLDAKVKGFPKNPPRPYQECIDYIRGIKCDEKECNLEKDRAWRTSLGYDHYYEHNWS